MRVPDSSEEGPETAAEHRIVAPVLPARYPGRVITHTKAYAAHKKQSTELLDFAVLVCQAVPQLKSDMKGGTALVPNDYFGGGRNLDQLKAYAQRYKSDLAIHVVFSSFALFDGYFQAACAEVLEFHGGAEHFAGKLRAALVDQEGELSADEKRDFAKLRDTKKGTRLDTYRKSIKRLRGGGRFLPSAFFSGLGILQLSRALDRGVRAYDIPGVMRDCFAFDLGARAGDISRIRDIRNRLAHSERSTLALPKAMQDAKTLRDIVVKFDAHLVKHLFVIEWP